MNKRYNGMPRMNEIDWIKRDNAINAGWLRDQIKHFSSDFCPRPAAVEKFKKQLKEAELLESQIYYILGSSTFYLKYLRD